MGDFLLMYLCGNLLEVGHRQMGVGDVGRFLLLACMDGYLTICEKCMSCSLIGRVRHCFSCPCLIGLIERFFLLACFWCGEYNFGIVEVGVILRSGYGM